MIIWKCIQKILAVCHCLDSTFTFTFNFRNKMLNPVVTLVWDDYWDNTVWKEMDEDLCNDKASKTRYSLWELIEIDVKEKKKIHSDRKNECNQCEYTSSNADSLRIHLMTHCGEKSNKCNKCDYASSDPSNLRTHLKRHSGEKSNKCNQC